MKTIVINLISNQDRLIRLFQSIAKTPGVTLRTLRSLDDGLDLKQGKASLFIFIQGRLTGLSGEIIARHVRNRLGKTKCRMALLAAPEDLSPGTKKEFGCIVDISLPDELLEDEIRRIVTSTAADSEKTGAVGPRTVKNAGTPPGRKQGARRQKAPAEELAVAANDSPEGVNSKVDAPAAANVDVVVSAGDGDKSEPPLEDPASGVAQESNPYPPMPADPYEFPVLKPGFHTLLEQSINDQGRGELNPGRGEPSYPVRPQRTSKPVSGRGKFITKAALAVFAVVVAAVGSALVFDGDEKTPQRPISRPVASLPVASVPKRPAPPAPVSAAAKSRQELTVLPSFIPKGSPDPAYGKANPGWERYRTDKEEYRVYREKSVIRAVQVLDRSGKGIGHSLFASILTEISGAPQYIVESQERKGEFLIEKGRLKDRGITIYRKNSDVKAFVVDLR
jgi:flagellar FliL protein